ADPAKRRAARSAKRNGSICTADSSDHRARWLLRARARRQAILPLHHANGGRTGREDWRCADFFAPAYRVAFAVSDLSTVIPVPKSFRHQLHLHRFHHINSSTHLHSIKRLLLIPFIFLPAGVSHSPKTNSAASSAPIGEPISSDTL